MFGRNGRNGSGLASVQPLAPAIEPSRALITTEKSIIVPSTREVARFLPVMDIDQAIARRDVIVRAMKELMREDVDYGKIPGCGDKPALLQPGADKLCNLFGLSLKYEFITKVEDWSGADHGFEPFFYYQVKALVYREDFLLGEGLGSCNSWESKYRWRKTERVCPSCGKANIRKSRDGGWYCWLRTDGCGAQFKDGDQSIEGQKVGRMSNPDVFDVVNTILKMANKRAKIAGTINATSASEFFTQDVEDFTVPEEQPIDTGNFRPGTSQAAQYVAQEKIRKQNADNTPPWRSMKELSVHFEKARVELGDAIWREEMERWGWHSFQDLVKAMDVRNQVEAKAAGQRAIECYAGMQARKGEA